MVPPHPAASAKQETMSAAVLPPELFPDGALPAHVHYRGSLTTPPYTETVEWLVLDRTFDASPPQIQRINTLDVAVWG